MRKLFAFDKLPWPGRKEWLAIAIIVGLVVFYVPLLLWKTVHFGQGDVQVFFRAGWAIWTGFPLYQVADHHGWTYHYPPTFALFMGPFASPLPGYPQPWWALPYPVAIVVWYVVNVLCLFAALHIWASALERVRPVYAKSGFLRGPWVLRLGPLVALLPFIGDGLARGQPAPVLLLLIVAFLVLYVENRVAAATFFFAFAATIKVFPLALAILPLLRRDLKFVGWTIAWCAILLVGLPVLCLGPTATLNLCRALWTEHLAGIISGSMSNKVAGEVNPGGYSSIGVGAVVARIAARGDFPGPLPGWASAIQYAFNAALFAAVAMLGRGRYWSLGAARPANGYPLLVAGAVLFAAMPLMIPFAGPQYATYAVPLMAVLIVETWRRAGEEVITINMIGWTVLAWSSMLALELPWGWIKTVGPMTWALLLLGPASLALVGKVSTTPAIAVGQRADHPAQ